MNVNEQKQGAKEFAELPLSRHPKYVVTCNFKSFLIYNMENPNGEPEEILLENLEKEYYDNPVILPYFLSLLQHFFLWIVFALLLFAVYGVRFHTVEYSPCFF